MLQKDLRQLSFENQPSLATYYIAATRKIFSSSVTVSKKSWPKFRVMEDDLRERHIPVRDYAYTVLSLLATWANKRGFKYVPFNVFLGQWAFDRFIKIWQSENIDLPDKPQDMDEITYSELLVARTYIAYNIDKNAYVRMSKIVAMCRQFVCDEWYELYSSKSRARDKFMYKVIDILCEEYGISDSLSSYTELLRNIS